MRWILVVLFILDKGYDWAWRFPVAHLMNWIRPIRPALVARADDNFYDLLSTWLPILGAYLLLKCLLKLARLLWIYVGRPGRIDLGLRARRSHLGRGLARLI